MIPLVAYERELELVKNRVVSVAEQEGLTLGTDFIVGTMIELPRACFIADQIARHADFFSFGTNDLTQCALGFSRDDIEGRIIPRYVEEKIVDGSPFRASTRPGWASSSGSRWSEDGVNGRTSNSACAVSTAEIRIRFVSSTTRDSTTSAAHRSVSRSRAWRPLRRQSRRRGSRPEAR